MEKWLPVVGFEDWYEVSNRGRIRNSYTGKVLRPAKQSKGYLTVLLYRGSKSERQSVLVHRLVAEAFIGPPVPGQQVNHKNGDKTYNFVENLEWCTPAQNTRHAYRLGLGCNAQSRHRGSGTPNAKLTEDIVRRMRAEFAGGRSITSLAKEAGVSHDTARTAIHRITWAHVE